MYINDVGANSFEEVNEGVARANYGWPTTEGTVQPDHVPPVPRPRGVLSALGRPGDRLRDNGRRVLQPHERQLSLLRERRLEVRDRAHRAAVGTLLESRLFEALEIPPDAGLGDAQVQAEVGYAKRAMPLQQLEDLLLPFFGEH